MRSKLPACWTSNDVRSVCQLQARYEIRSSPEPAVSAAFSYSVWSIPVPVRSHVPERTIDHRNPSNLDRIINAKKRLLSSHKINHKKSPLLTMMMPAMNDDARSKKQESCPTTSPASVREFWGGLLPSLPSNSSEERTAVEETARRHQSRSKVIPMRVVRGSSPSELQLYQEHAEADARDYSMFIKVYDHLQQQRTRTTDQAILAENALCMDRLIQTRCRHIHESSSMRGRFGGSVSSLATFSGADGADRKHYQLQEDEEDDIGEDEDIFQLDL
jgi:hypothetical protein